MIEQFYLIHRWDSNKYYHSSQSGPKGTGCEGVLHIPQTPKLVPHHQMEVLDMSTWYHITVETYDYHNQKCD